MPEPKSAAPHTDGQPAAETWAFALALTAAFASVALFTALRHEMWRDELQAWLIASESRTFAELVWNMRYDGHPPLWYVLLYAASRITQNPLAMKLLHVSVATASVLVVARRAPFTRLQKTLFAFGYFPLYEYAAISRNYALGILCLFAFCAAYRAGAAAKNYVALAAALALLANTSAYGLMIALAFALMLAYELWRARGGERAALRSKWRELTAAAVILASGVGVSAAQMLPPRDGGNIIGWRFYGSLADVANVLRVAWRGFAPLPIPEYHFWNSNVMAPPVGAALACVVLAAAALMLARRRPALVAFAAGAGAMLLFTLAKFHGYNRHHGHFYVLFVACAWVAAVVPRAEAPRHKRWARVSLFLESHKARALVALFAVHVAAAAVACAVDWRYPFSHNQRVAEYLRAEGFDDLYIVGDEDAMVSPVAAYLGRKIYYPRGDREGTFIVWDADWRYWPQADALDAARRKAVERGEDVLVISNYRLGPRTPAGVVPVTEFTGSIVGDEDYFLYLVRHDAASAELPRDTPP